MNDQPRIPNNKQRLAIVGATGSGKTVAACWHLSLRDFNKRSWLIYNFKGDELIDSIERAEHVDVNFVPSKRHRGLFIVHPFPSQTEEVRAQMWKLWERENVGVYVDEGYMIGDDNDAFDALLTQGRSKRIPMIVLSQRPVWMSRFTFSESDFYQLFRLQDLRDEKTVSQFVRKIPANYSDTLPEFHSYYYDVGRNRLYRFSPVPGEDEILERINSKLQPRRNWI